jgi:fimbrial chaperone protein
MIHELIGGARRAGILLLLALLAPAAWGFEFSPIEATLRPVGPGAIQTFSVENPGPEPIAVEVTLMARDMAADGEELLEPAGDAFSVYPTQMIVQPGGRQSIRLKWNGSENPERERAYRLIAEQLPIDLGEPDSEGGAVDLLVRYVASVYVRPDNGAARLSLSLANDDEGVVLSIENRGTVHAIVKADDLALLDSEGPIDWSDAQRAAIGPSNVLAGRSRTIPLPDTEGLVGRDLSVRWTRASD